MNSTEVAWTATSREIPAPVPPPVTNAASDSSGPSVPARRRLRSVALFGWLGLALLCRGDVSARAAGPADPDGDRKPLINAGDFPAGWNFHPADKQAKLSDTWKVVKDAESGEPVLVCLGKPLGYIRTKDAYDDFELSVEWRYVSDPNCNSGLLLYTNGTDKIWPKSVQVQLHRPLVGSIFPLGGARSAARATVKDLKLEIGEWQKCAVTSRDGTVSVAINGRKVSEIRGCDPKKGCIALQSEGSEIHFRRMVVRSLKPSE